MCGTFAFFVRKVNICVIIYNQQGGLVNENITRYKRKNRRN